MSGVYKTRFLLKNRDGDTDRLNEEISALVETKQNDPSSGWSMRLAQGADRVWFSLLSERFEYESGLSE